MTTPAQTLHDALPANPDYHGPIGVGSDAVRQLLAEHTRLRTELHAELRERYPTGPAEDGA
jgi:hypothetical protein